MATLGNVPAEAYTNTVKDSFSGNGSATAFTMSLPTVTNDVRVVVENVIQDPTVAYSVSGTTLTFTSAPPTGTNNIYVVHLGPAAMTAVPPAEIADATTFASSLTVQGAFTSKGIDDNADAVALTIDSSENVLYGTTDTTLYNNTTGTGTKIGGDGRLDVARQADTVATFNRTGSSDGEVIRVVASGTTVGSIGTTGGDVTIDGGSEHTGLRFESTQITPRHNGAYSNNATGLGTASNRFKDLYLGEGIYLGGTGSANKLDDYEEGTWTATINGQTTAPSSPQTTTAYYTKVGNMVTVFMRFSNKNTTGASGALTITGLPFSCSAVGSENQSAVPMVHNLPVTEKYMTGYIPNGSTTIEFINIKNNTAWTTAQISSTTGVYLNMNMTYQTAS